MDIKIILSQDSIFKSYNIKQVSKQASFYQSIKNIQLFKNIPTVKNFLNFHSNRLIKLKTSPSFLNRKESMNEQENDTLLSYY